MTNDSEHPTSTDIPDATFLTLQPPGPLRRWVEAYWYFHDPRPTSGIDRVLPVPGLQLIFPVGEGGPIEKDAQLPADGWRLGIVDAPRMQATLVDRRLASHCFGISVRPAAVKALLGIPAHELQGGTWSLEALWGARGRGLATRLRETTSLSAFATLASHHLFERVAATTESAELRMATRISAAIERAPARRLGDLLVAEGVYPDEALRSFREHVGLRPKQLQRILRARIAADQMAAGTPLVEAALLAGYADQAHFSRDFKSISGLTPARWRAEIQCFASHAGKNVQSDLTGEPS